MLLNPGKEDDDQPARFALMLQRQGYGRVCCACVLGQKSNAFHAHNCLKGRDSTDRSVVLLLAVVA